VYGGVPPLNETVVARVEFSLLSTVSGFELMTGAASAGLTVTVTSADATDADVLSVTWSSKDQTPIIDRVPVEIEGMDEAVQLKEPPGELKLPAPGASSSHWHVY
jgi:hypothetical protein